MATRTVHAPDTEILRQKWSLGGPTASGPELRISTGAVGTTVLRARAPGSTGLRSTRSATTDCTRGSTDRRPRHASPRRPGLRLPACRAAPPGVTLELLHLEYLEQHPTATATRSSVSATALVGRRGLSMRQVIGGRQLSSTTRTKPTIIDATTASDRGRLFVAVSAPRNT